MLLEERSMLLAIISGQPVLDKVAERNFSYKMMKNNIPVISSFYVVFGGEAPLTLNRHYFFAFARSL